MQRNATTVEAAIAVMHHGDKPRRGLRNKPLDELIWPLGRPERLRQGRVGDMAQTDHLIVPPSNSMWLGLRRETRARISLMITEPAVVHRRHMQLARRFHRRFHRVLTCNPELLAALPNGLAFPFGSSWVPDWAELDPAKTKMLSLIASAKRQHEGHKLRHECAEWLRNIGIDADIMGRGYQPFERKADGLAPYRYSLVIENVREPGYFSEKLVDAALCMTVPIYWGAPDIAEYFDPAGMVICESFEDIKVAVARMSPGDYLERSEALTRNRALAADFADTEGRAARAIADTL